MTFSKSARASEDTSHERVKPGAAALRTPFIRATNEEVEVSNHVVYVVCEEPKPEFEYL